MPGTRRERYMPGMGQRTSVQPVEAQTPWASDYERRAHECNAEHCRQARECLELMKSWERL
jgi:hypothetical protein